MTEEPSCGRLAGCEPVALHEHADGPEVHLEPVPSHDGAERLLVRWTGVVGGQ